MGIHVGEGETAAEYRLPDPAGVADFLAWMADGRTD